MAEIIVALDLPAKVQALEMAKKIHNRVAWLKVGLELYVASGPDLIAELKDMGYKIFLDLKFYDIPNTVAGAVRSVCATGAGMLTIHCQGGERMAKAAMDAALAFGAERPIILGITSLTSFDHGEMPGIKQTPQEYAYNLAALAANWQLDGIVCSGFEAANIKHNFPSLIRVCPGIRPAGNNAGDQRRVMTPERAVEVGADYLVIGRPVTQAENPATALDKILCQINHT